MSKRIDFKHVRAHADFSAVLASYGLELQKDGSKGGQFKCLCPFHEDTKPSLKVNTQRNVYHCFACGAKGNVLEFVMNRDGIEIRPAAEKVAELSGCSLSDGTPPVKKQKASSASSAQPAAETPPNKADEAELDGESYNLPLTFELKLSEDDELKVWLEERGVNHHLQKDFGLGRASKRSKTIADRLAIPLHDQQGRVIGYCGRYLGDADADDVPKYVLPKGFRKELEVFNWHRVAANEDRRAVVIAESYLSVMRHHYALNMLSTFGRSISPQQVEAIAALEPGRIFVVADGDEPGYAGAREIAGALSGITWTRAVDLLLGVKPHHLTNDELAEILRPLW